MTTSSVYLGVLVLGHLGGTDVDITDRALLYGGELGYGFEIERIGGLLLVVRPQVGVGGVSVFHTDPSATAPSTTGRGRTRVDVVSSASGRSSSSSSNTTTITTVYVEPGVLGMLTSGAGFFGVDAGVRVIPNISYSGATGTTWLSYVIDGQIGTRF